MSKPSNLKEEAPLGRIGIVCKEVDLELDLKVVKPIIKGTDPKSKRKSPRISQLETSEDLLHRMNLKRKSRET